MGREVDPLRVGLFDVALQSSRLSADDLSRLSFFEVRGALISPEPSRFVLATDQGDQATRDLAEREIPRLRRAGLLAFGALGLPPEIGVGGELEQALHHLTPRLGDNRVVAVGPSFLRGGAIAEHVFTRQAELARALDRPFLAAVSPQAEIREVRRLLSLLRECAIAPERTLLLGLPWAGLRLAIEYGYFAALTFAGVHPPGAKLLEVVNRLGGQRLVLGSGGGDFLALPKAAALLEEGAIPRSVRRRLLWGNAIDFLRLTEAVRQDDS
jgi:predicted metal-dependent TIM-barrel fold hydrolase